MHDEASIEGIAEIGLILLLFLIGLELSLPRLLQAGRVITVSGLLKVPLCAAVAWVVLAPVAAITGGPFDRLYLAVATGFASTLILVKMLSDKQELSSFAGRVTLGILVFEDLYAIAFLALQPNLPTCSCRRSWSRRAAASPSSVRRSWPAASCCPRCSGPSPGPRS